MLPLLLISVLVSADTGSSSSLTEDLCYGSKYRLPSHFTPPLYTRTITYSPRAGDPKTVVNNGLSLDRRFQVSQDGIEMSDLTEQDDNAVLSTEAPVNFVKLMVKNCGSVGEKLYGSSVMWSIPNGAGYLEFSRFAGSDVPAQPIILWNRTDSSHSRGVSSGNDYVINFLTQQDSGYYRFRGGQHQLLKWEQVLVREYEENLSYNKGNYIVIEFPKNSSEIDSHIIPSEIRFTKKGADTYMVLQQSERVDITDRYMSIEDSRSDDSGTYDFVDAKGDPIMRAVVEIKNEDDPPAHWFIYVAVSVFFVAFTVLGGRFCWNRHQNKKRAASQAEAVPPALSYLRARNTASGPTSV